MEKQKLVVIGNGMAGARFVEEVVARDGRERFDIVMFGEEPYGNYNRILLSSVLAGNHDPKDIFINPLSWYEDHGVKLHLGVKAGWIDRSSKSVYGPGGVLEPYDQLVIATGSVPFIPPLSGMCDENGEEKDGIFVFRSLDDCERIVAYGEKAQRAVVIGGGLLGLEAAKGLLNRHLEVHVVHLVSHIMDMQLDSRGGAVLQKSLEEMGLRVHLEKSTTAVLGNGHVTGVAMKDGVSLDCDMVVIAAGIRPNADLAKAAGLNVERGIVVNEDMSCRNDPTVYAIGECAQHGGKTYGLVAPLWEQARVLAERLTERNPGALYSGSRISTKLKVMGIDLTVMGEKDEGGPNDEIVQYLEPARGVYKKLIVRDGMLVGAILIGDGIAAPAVLQAFDRNQPLMENRAELLFPSAGPGKVANVEDWPDSAQVCNCNGVSKARIVASVKAGNRTLKALCDATKAGTGCGSCKPEVQLLLESSSDGLLAEDPSVHYYVPGVPLRKPELIEAVKDRGLRSVTAVLAEMGNGKEDSATKTGLASLLKTVWGKDYEDERDARFINDRVHANIQKDSTFSVVPRIYGGVTSPEQLRKIADVAEKYQARMLKITGGQRIDLLGITKEHLPDVWRELGMPSGHAYTKAMRTCKTCVGSEFCRFGLGDSTGLGIKVEKRFQGMETPHKVKMAVSGCPRNCAESTTKDVGVVAIEGGKWEVYVGGASGSRVRKADVLCVVDTHDEALRYIGRFMQYYRERAKYKERTYDFVERLGIESLRQVLVDDAEGIHAQLDAAAQASVDSYSDPWSEGDEPKHSEQFRSLIAATER